MGDGGWLVHSVVVVVVVVVEGVNGGDMENSNEIITVFGARNQQKNTQKELYIDSLPTTL